MSPERWRPFSSTPGPDDPQYWKSTNPEMSAADACSAAFWYQSVRATEMWEHIQYLQAGRVGESPYFHTEDITGGQELRTIAPLVLTFVRFVQANHPEIPEDQLVESVRAAIYDPGVLDLVRLIHPPEATPE